MGFFKNLIVKLNPGQREIYNDEGDRKPSTNTKLLGAQKAYELVEVVNRCVNMIVDNASLIDFEVGERMFTGQYPGVHPARIKKLLNDRPNLYMDSSTFRRLSIQDLVIEGNIFWYFDGSALYHLPAKDMVVVPDEVTYINSYLFGPSEIEYRPEEIIHVKDNSIVSVYRGDSRMLSVMNTLYAREDMENFQRAFFKSGTSMGMIFETDALLNDKLKKRKIAEWMRDYSPTSGSGKPVILDGGMTAKNVTQTNFRDLAFEDSIREKEKKVALALGIPNLLLDGGNNANIKPNLELWFYTQIIPMLRKVESALEYYFGLDIELTTSRVPALFPDKKAETDRLVSLKNNGIISGNEARTILKMDTSDDPEMDKIIQPKNIAGSAAGGEGGGRPEETDE